MRDWFAAFRNTNTNTSEVMVTRVTKVTPDPTHCKMGVFDHPRPVAQEGNARVTKVTPAPGEKELDGEDAQFPSHSASGKSLLTRVTQPLPRGQLAEVTTKGEKRQSVNPSVTHVTHQIEIDPTRCAHCGEGERSGAMIVPFGTEAIGHTWLHSECWRAWYTKRSADGGPGEARR